jgi:hypothetical protein
MGNIPVVVTHSQAELQEAIMPRLTDKERILTEIINQLYFTIQTHVHWTTKTTIEQIMEVLKEFDYGEREFGVTDKEGGAE